MASAKITATTLWPERFSRSPRPDGRLTQSDSPRCSMSSSSDEQNSSICETPISNLRVPRRCYNSEPFPWTKHHGRYTSRSDDVNQNSAPPPKVYRINMGLTGSIPALNLSSTSANSANTNARNVETRESRRSVGICQDTNRSSSAVHDTPMPSKVSPECSPLHWIKAEHGRLARLVAMEKLKTIMRVTFHRSTVGAAFSILKSNVNLARDLDTRARLESIIEQRQSEMLEWEAELEQLRVDNELRCQEIEKLNTRKQSALLAEKDQRIAELEIKLKVHEDDLKHEQSERQNSIRNSQRERLTEMRELSRRMKARVLTVRRKFRLLNYCMSTWYHARLKIWQRNELGRVHRELQTAKHEYTLAAREVNTCKKELIDARMESEEIKNAVWSVWTNQVSYNDRRLKKLMRGLSRLVDGIGPDMQHGSKSFFETLMRHYRNSGVTAASPSSESHMNRPQSIAVV